jgi:uncharacterized protein YprB with RNaseH-like and TPR domain
MIKIYFDMETYPAFNPHHKDAKIILAQILVENKLQPIILKEWEIGEKKLISELYEIFSKLPKFTPVVTYNGEFDFRWLSMRIGTLFEDREEREKMYYPIFMKRKHCDLMQYNKKFKYNTYGSFVRLEDVLKKYNIKMKSPYRGSHMKELYDNKDYRGIIEHGIDDVVCLEQLLKISNVSDRYFKGDDFY